MPHDVCQRVAPKVGNLLSKFGHIMPLGSRIIRYVRDGRTDRRTEKTTLTAPFSTDVGIIKKGDNFFGPQYIFLIKNAWKVPSCTRPTAQGLHCRMLQIISCCNGRYRGAAFARSVVFVRRLTEEPGTPKVAQMFAYGNACVNLKPWMGLCEWSHDFPQQIQYIIHNAYYTTRPIWTKDGSKRVVLR